MKTTLKRIFKSVRNASVITWVLGSLLYLYLLFVRYTSSLTIDKAYYQSLREQHAPMIFAMWHGQHFLIPFARHKDHEVTVLISKSRDGEINAIAAQNLGMRVIRGSGARESGQVIRKGGIKGFKAFMALLSEGQSVALTADVPKGPARVTGEGIIKLAMHSECPIIPIAIASSRRKTMSSWDKASLNMPFSKIAMEIGEPIYIPKDITDMVAYCDQLTNALNSITTKAYAQVDH